MEIPLEDLRAVEVLFNHSPVVGLPLEGSTAEAVPWGRSTVVGASATVGPGADGDSFQPETPHI